MPASHKFCQNWLEQLQKMELFLENQQRHKNFLMDQDMVDLIQIMPPFLDIIQPLGDKTFN
ncbi:hypothetical protein CMI46_00480 [Candidatus Pacearchaeota archaeon]|nr:hypothetical protein [Candidatus Pacearchaeota archaeon]